MNVTLLAMTAEWAGVIATGATGLIALALLVFEVRLARHERRLRKEAEANAARDLSLERARRVVAWLEPIMWQVNSQGVEVRRAGGWKLVISNDTDDTLSNWRANVIVPDPVEVDQLLLEAAAVDHGVIPPCSRFEADMPRRDGKANVPPDHQDLSAVVALWWVDREAHFWHSRGAAEPFPIPAEEGRWSVQHREVAARHGGIGDVRRPSFSATRLN